MPIQTIHKNNNNDIYFISCTVVHWYHVFDRQNRWQILADSLNYCVKQKDLKIYGFVFMLNHIHLLFSASDAAGIIRDFKKFTAKKIRDDMKEKEPQVLKLFTNDKGEFHLWQETNMPILIESEKVFKQKLEYIHNNPVRKQYVAKPEYWYWSSANPDCEVTLEPIG